MNAAADTLSAALGDLGARGEAIAVRPADGPPLTYSELDQRASRLRSALSGLGLGPGDRFAFMLPNGSRILECYLACARGGFAAVPISDRLAPGELIGQLRSAGVSAVLCGEGATELAQAERELEATRIALVPGTGAPDYEALLAAAAPDPDPVGEPDDLLCLMYTGGTTGVSKAAMQTQRSWASCVRSVAAEWALRSSDRHLVVLPMDHVSWFTSASILAVGGELLLEPGWDPERVLTRIEAERVTTLNMIPTMLGDLLATLPAEGGPDLSSLRLLTVAGSPMPAEMYERARAVFGPIIGCIYGLTETSGPVTYLLPGDLSVERLRSGGRPGAEVELRILGEDGNPAATDEPGEILLRGPQVTSGYLGMPEETEAAFLEGWFRTGDVGRVDGDGFLYIVDRSKDMVKSGGFNVYPKEVEEVLYAHPGVREASVVGVSDPRWIEAVHAGVVLSAPAAATEAELIAHCRAHLPGYKVPKAIHIESSLPRTKVGKPDKRALRDRFNTLVSE